MATKADVALSSIKETLGRRYLSGTTVTNCVTHMGLSILERPDNCSLCQTDVKNTLSRCMRANEWLNLWRDDIMKGWKEFSKELLIELGSDNG